jgi:hypothetical protein
MNINIIKSNILESKNKKDFSNFLDNELLDIQVYFESLNNQQLDSIKFDIEDIVYDLIDNQFILETDNSLIINAFLILLAELLEELKLTSAIIEIIEYLPKNITISQRLNAILLYSKVNDISTEYHNKFEKIISLIDKSKEEEQFIYKPIFSVIYFYLQVIGEFKRAKKRELSKSFRELFNQKSDKYTILKESIIVDVVSSISIDNSETQILSLKEKLKKNKIKKSSFKKEIISEVSQYSKKLYQLENPNFNKIRKISASYIINMGNPNYLHYQLNHGTTIIEEENLLYKYLLDYGKMHKEKLYSSFNKIVHRVNNKTINIIDWGCGQALATSLLIDYIKENELNIDISNITLIEPSSLALSRGMLHIDVLKENKIEIKAVNKDIDSLEISDLIINNSNITLHLFSNILDVEFFRLDRAFLEKISSSQKGLNYFICVSPNINDKRNMRLNLFYSYFDNHFKTELISDRDSDIGKYKRYERVFKAYIIKG